MKRVAVVGGGLSGLSCAYALSCRGIDVIVFESSERPGGRDTAAFYLLAPDLFRNTFRLINELGLEGEILPIAPHAGQFYKGRVYHHRVASATGLLSFKGLNIADKALLPRMAYLLARHGSRLDFHEPERGLDFDKESAASFVKRELSQNVLNYVAGPLISTLFYYGSEETSAWLYLVLAKHMHNVRMSTVRGGTQRLTEALSRNLNVRKGRAVAGIEAEGKAYRIDDELFSDVVIAVPGDEVLRIDGVESLLEEQDRLFFRNCRYQRIVSVRVATCKPVDGRCYAVSIPRVEQLSASAISFHDFIDPASVPAGEGLLTISGGGVDVDAEKLLRDLKRLYALEVGPTGVFEYKSGMPKFPPGRYLELTNFRQRQRRPGLFFCGDYLLGPLIEAAITTGLKAAEAIP